MSEREKVRRHQTTHVTPVRRPTILIRGSIMKLILNVSVPEMDRRLSPNLRTSLANKSIEKSALQIPRVPNIYPMAMGLNPKPPSSIGMAMNRGKREVNMPSMNAKVT